MKTLHDYTTDEIRDMDLIDLTRLREEAYPVQTAAMLADDGEMEDGTPIALTLAAWAERMAAAKGPMVQIHRTRTGWLEALLVGRYGEAPDHWPSAFSPDDVRRALRWEDKGQPFEGVRYL